MDCEKKVVDVFVEGFEFLVLTETKLKVNEEVLWCEVNGLIAGVQKMERAREEVVILLNDVRRNKVIDFGVLAKKSSELNSSFLGLKFVW